MVFKKTNWDRQFPKLQILIINNLLSGKGIDMGYDRRVFKQVEQIQRRGRLPAKTPIVMLTTGDHTGRVNRIR